MNAQQFIKEHGVEKARKVVEGAPEWAIFWITQGEYHISMLSFPNMTGHQSFLISDLKRLVDSVDLVKRYGGIAEAKTLHQDEFWDEVAFKILKKAIVDYESIYCVADMGDDTHIENHVSPNCKKFDERVNGNETN